MALWNQRDITPPTTMNGTVKSKHIKAEICALTITSGSMLDYFSSLDTFEKAAAYLTRFCNHYKLRMRNIHGFQIMRRLNQTLLRIKSMNIPWDVLNFHSFLPEASYIEKEVNLPVRSNLEYLLVRLQGLVKLLLRVVYLTKETSRYQLKQISEVFLYFQNITFLSLMGELWVLARDMCRRVDQFYSELHRALPILPVSEENWLAEDYQLPASLAEWLGEEFENEIIKEVDKKAVLDLGDDPSIFALLEHQEVDEDAFATQVEEGMESMWEQEKAAETTTISAIPKTMLMEKLRSDTGELVSRASDGPDRRATKKAPAPFDPAKLDHIRSKYHVKQFVTEERTKRTEQPRQAITCRISESKFGDFNARLMKEFNRLSSAEFVSFFKKKFIEMIKGGNEP